MLKTAKRAVLLFLCLTLALIPCFGIVAQAQTLNELTISFLPGGTAAQGVQFEIYKVADVTASGELTFTKDFSAYPITVEDADMSALTVTLCGYVAADSIEPFASGKTDVNGNIRFAELEDGLYLVIGGTVGAENETLTAVPFLLQLPATDIQGEIQREVAVSVKHIIYGSLTQVEVRKVWHDGGSSSRPEQVTIELYCGKKLYDTVILSCENQWRHCWELLSGNELWSVKEVSVVPGYTVSVDQQDDVFTVTNTKTDGPGSTLPQTGMLWWPVPLLVTAGLALLFFSRGSGRKQGK